VSKPVVGIVSPGDMGAAIGAVTRDAGLDVVACLSGRGPLTRSRAKEAGIRDVESLDELVSVADLMLSVLVPAEAVGVSELLAASMSRTGAKPVVADCNAVAPATAGRICNAITAAGAAFVDAGIIGPPPRKGSSATRIYCSGPDCAPLLALNAFGLDVRQVGSAVGQASGLKMVFAASTKGTTALWTELLVAARSLGLDDALAAEFALGRGDLAQRLIGQIPGMPRRAHRWIGEMEEIATTFADVGLTPRILLGAADVYRLVGETPLADQTSRQPDPPLDTILATLVDALKVPREDATAARDG